MFFENWFHFLYALRREVCFAGDPVFGIFKDIGGHKPDVRFPAWENTHHPGPAANLFIQSFDCIGSTDLPFIKLWEPRLHEYEAVGHHLGGSIQVTGKRSAPFLGRIYVDLKQEVYSVRGRSISKYVSNI